MPRKSKPPVYPIEIEGLSTVIVPDREVFRDDMTGELRTGPQPKPLARASRSFADLSKLKAERKLATVQGVIKQRQTAIDLVHRLTQPTLRSNAKPGERSIKLSNGLEVIMPAKPWRRV